MQESHSAVAAEALDVTVAVAVVDGIAAANTVSVVAAAEDTSWVADTIGDMNAAAVGSGGVLACGWVADSCDALMHGCAAVPDDVVSGADERRIVGAGRHHDACCHASVAEIVETATASVVMSCVHGVPFRGKHHWDECPYLLAVAFVSALAV